VPKMLLRSPPNQKSRSARLADPIYIGFVDTLLVEIPGLLLSGAATVAAGIVAALHVGGAAMWGCVAAMIVVITGRAYVMALHARARPSPDAEAARKWETRFVVGAVLFMAVLSTWTFTAFYATEDGFARFMAITITIPYAFGMWTRSFAIDRGTNAQALVAFLPLSGAMLVAGGWYPWMIVVGFLSLFIFIKSSSSKLKATFRAELSARTEIGMLAGRLDSALNNMSHGMCMISAEGKVLVSNTRFSDFLGFSQKTSLEDTRLAAILRVLGRRGAAPAESIARLRRLIDVASLEGEPCSMEFETRDDCVFEITLTPNSRGGWVMVVQDITAKRDADRVIDQMAHFDSVTNLRNRRSFELALTQALEVEGRRMNVMFLDLDDFKQVNDTLGHRTGDKLLAEIARRLKGVVGSSDLVARWGGDEFVILHHEGPGRIGTAMLAKQIIDEVSRPVVIDGSEVIVGASIGSACAPDDGLSADTLLSNADIALYAAKADGRRGWRAFEPAMDTKIQIRRLVELELRAAVATEAIDVHYQPILDVRSRRIVGFEALARWRHPSRGAVSPAEFIPILEDIGLIEELGASVLRRACIACASWPEGISISVNLSPSQFRGGHIERTIHDALKAANLAPERLDIEITESTLLEDRGGDTRRTLQALRAHGVRISLDDFGTGYSSLSYLLSFPLDRIKIDRSFTVGLGLQERAAILVESVAAMSRKLGMTVLIEGVETERQMRVIEELGTITEVQGFLFSPPVPQSSLPGLIGEPQPQHGRAAA
jgi:diguanylate cyclase (GGDEF)-like protein